MIPIYENNNKNNGLGYSYDTFIKRFIDICEEHLSNHRAKSFMFIFYDFEDTMHKLLFDDYCNKVLDRVSSNSLSVFYIHTRDKSVIDKFNTLFFTALEIKEKHIIPFILFFNINKGNIVETKVIELRDTHSIPLFNTLKKSIVNKVNENQHKALKENVAKYAKQISVSLFLEILKKALQGTIH
ncbi:hypothetical protein [Parabacteroides gordonii]|uniref:hypothetical protein n=1 Tax=Parabacteroides gordonii TaxID=574930 RepID=UPI0026ED60E8|nr:hypothetical protein [Parabacteroides gordonii]